MDMDATTANRSKRQSRSLPLIKPKPSISGNVGLGRTFFLSAKVCTSCVQPLGLFLSRGSNCPKCGLKVCKKCKAYRDNFSNWTCLVCSKELPNYVNKSITIGGKSKKYRGDSSYSNIKRSWSISATNRGSPILKAYTKYNGDDRGYNSLPRMPTSTGQGYNGQGQSNNYGGGHQYAHPLAHAKTNSTTTALLNVLDSPFQSTLHPYMTDQGQRSPSSSINFIEDEYWDYYDYEINSNRSSCERSLGESVEYKYQHVPDPPPPPPKKPMRTKGRSRSVGSYDTINPKYSQLKTYCVVNMNANSPPQKEDRNPDPPLSFSFTGKNNSSYSSLPLRKTRSSSLGKENIIKIGEYDQILLTKTSNEKKTQLQPIRIQNEVYASQSLPRKIRKENNTEIRHWPSTYNTSNTLPKEWKILKRRNNGSTTIVIRGVNSPPNPSDLPISPLVYSKSSKTPRSHSHLSRTYITGVDATGKNEARVTQPQLSPSRKFPIKEPYPFFPKQIQAFQSPGHRELRPLLPLYQGVDDFHGIFKLSPITPPSAGEIPELAVTNLSSSSKFLSASLRDNGSKSPIRPSSSASSSSSTVTLIGEKENNNNNNSREVIIEITRECKGKSNENVNGNIISATKTSVKKNVTGGDSLRSISSVCSSRSRSPSASANNSKCSSNNKPSTTPVVENNGIMGTSIERSINRELRSDPIGSESDSSLSDSSFHSLTPVVENNNGMDAMGVKVFRGEDKDEFLSCNVSSEEDDDGVGATGRREDEKLLVPKNTPENSSAVEKNHVGLSDQRVEGGTTPPNSGGGGDDEDDDKIVLEGELLLRSSGPDDEVRKSRSPCPSMSTLTNQNIRKYKSRVLIGPDEDQTVEITGESEVEIVIGTSTYVKKEKDFSGSDHEVEASCQKENKLNGHRHGGPLDPTPPPSFPRPPPYVAPKSAQKEHNNGKKEVVALPLEKISSESRSFEIAKNHEVNIKCEIENDEEADSPVVCERMAATKVPLLLGDSYFRESPEGEESCCEERKSENPKEKVPVVQIPESVPVPAPNRSSPDGADAEKSETSSTSTPTPVIEMNSEDECKSESTDSWTEEVTFVEEHPGPLDMTLHTICEESETESEYKTTPTNFSPVNENREGLEKYFNFTSSEGILGERCLDPRNYEESEFSDTFSESSCSSELRNSVDFSQLELMDEGDPVELASGRLEKYFLNLGVALSNDSDSVGSESESGSSVLENKKKVLKHHRRSAEFDDEHYEVSEDDDCAFEQDGFDTIKKQRKLRKSQEDLLRSDPTPEYPTLPPPPPYPYPYPIASSTGYPDPKASEAEPTPSTSHSAEMEESLPQSKLKKMTQPSVSRSNSFNWSSDEEVNLMMRSLRQLIKNMTLSKKPEEGKGEKLMYLENELIRLMKNEQNMKNIVEHMSSDSEDQEDVYKFFEKADNQPELLSKVMTHIGERLNTWMRDEDEDNATIKCAQSVSSDLNDDLESDTRFSWKGSFESTLAKRQSVGSSDSLDCGPIPNDGTELFSDRSILRSSSLHHLANSQPILEECESLTSSLTRLHHPSTSSGAGPSGSGSVTQSIKKSKSLFLDPHREVKSARYRPPGYFEAKTMPNDTHSSTPVLTHQNGDEAEKENSKRFVIRGHIEFSMQYNYKNSIFEVSIKQCRDLAAVDAKKGRSDPYVKGYLLPDRAKSNKKKTKTKKNTLNPVFGETLKFHISLEELETRTLWLSVWHSDMFGKNEFLGQVTLPLKGLTFDDTNFSWYSLKEEEVLPSSETNLEESPKLDLILALKWTSNGFNRDRGNLSVLVKEAKGLKLIKSSLPSTFIKCSSLNDRTKKQKTPLAKRTMNPVWNATMNFEGVTSEGLEVALYNSDLLNHEQIGNLKLDCDSELWRNMGKREGFWVEGIVQLTMI